MMLPLEVKHYNKESKNSALRKFFPIIFKKEREKNVFHNNLANGYQIFGIYSKYQKILSTQLTGLIITRIYGLYLLPAEGKTLKKRKKRMS